MRYLFRVNTYQGIGHLMRCRWLATALQSQGQSCCFFVDKNTDLDALFDSFPFDIVQLEADLAEKQDAQQFISSAQSKIGDLSSVSVVVDNYQLGAQWEADIKKSGARVIALDDIHRTHSADVVIDQRLDLSGERNYSALVTQETSLLLGPDYTLLNPVYERAVNKGSLAGNNVLISLGGGGDWSQIEGLVQKLAEQRKVSLTVIVGPQAKNIHYLHQLQSSGLIELVESPESLIEYYQRCDLFFGALGTSLYELAATLTPALTFALAPNQENDWRSLDALGHFFHLGNLKHIDFDDVMQAIYALLDNLVAVKAMREAAPVRIDGQGAKRIARFLNGEDITLKTERSQSDECLRINDHLSYRDVIDQDINLYRNARNRPNNSEKMTVTQDVKLGEHIKWWFNNQRHSQILYYQGAPTIVMWHQLVRFDEQEYLIGGWFTTDVTPSFDVVTAALEWQLQQTFKSHPNAAWIAVINKENKFVNLLNQYLGFQRSREHTHYYLATQRAFPKATDNDFNFVHLENTKMER
ncbi:UDP-2,4-diacetamido-2,4,6-trideoxy-beta-L-altropyranose hydrolase [Pseudoalteromonas luteoviolacea]|uniref:Uncharacterized protein n=1 Tax=Pseudoalteromonas luteoviolacea DSM 6061 TaxID=1365250 RepID=A0A166VKX2_9GAMM|nr:UDP-2,4-diacetamido-2,4,6-trideoxy-beta-L-altropyranose hydrolase [Pseudoalteromonas luteoviolacea]KZN32980.1 hypothetical protein N475_20890 [Pseudoalteromonas luteoviolacea DSM 6061]